jgi:hypothetical protein
MWSTHSPLGLIGKVFLSIQVKCGGGGGDDDDNDDDDDDDDSNDTMMKLRK